MQRLGWAFSSFEFSCGDVSHPCPELDINLRPIISEKRERYPLIAAFGIWHASAGKGMSLHALIQSECGCVHPDGKRYDDTLCGSSHVAILLQIGTKHLDISQRLQRCTQGFSDIRMRRQATEMAEYLPIDARL
jgi:hypothetical protein